eukprot:2071873-Prymnesium_polylepis.1
MPMTHVHLKLTSSISFSSSSSFSDFAASSRARARRSARRFARRHGSSLSSSDPGDAATMAGPASNAHSTSTDLRMSRSDGSRLRLLCRTGAGGQRVGQSAPCAGCTRLPPLRRTRADVQAERSDAGAQRAGAGCECTERLCAHVVPSFVRNRPRLM